MTLGRLLGLAVAIVLLAKIAPVVAPMLWPRIRARAERLRKRADVAGGVVMLGFVVGMLVRREPVYAAVVAVVSLPVFVAAATVVVAWLRAVLR